MICAILTISAWLVGVLIGLIVAPLVYGWWGAEQEDRCQENQGESHDGQNT